MRIGFMATVAADAPPATSTPVASRMDIRRIPPEIGGQLDPQ
jgi:hypothetical protein